MPANGRFEAIPLRLLESANTVVRHWWALVLRGMLAVLFGALLIASPSIGLGVLVMFFGIYALVSGVFAISAGIRAEKEQRSWGAIIFEGILSIAAGLLALAVPHITLGALVFVIGFWAVAIGVLELVAAFRLRQAIQREWLLGLDGVISIAFGIYALLRPGRGAQVIAVVMGIYALLFGVVQLGLGFRLGRLDRQLPRQVPV